MIDWQLQAQVGLLILISQLVEVKLFALETINPLSGHYCKIRALIDSEANPSLLDRRVAKAVGLSGQKQIVTINTADGGSWTHEEVEVAFQLAKKDKSFDT